MEAANRNKSVQARINKRTVSECIDQEILDEILEKIGIQMNDPDLDGKINDYLNRIFTKRNG